MTVQHTKGTNGTNGSSGSPAWAHTPMRSQERKIRVIIVGAGLSGLSMIHSLRRFLPNVEVVAYEKNADIGGTWLENRYPGCDIPSHIYQFSWAPNHRWSKYYSSSHEILAYIKNVAEKDDLLSNVHLGHAVNSARWNDRAGAWDVQVEGPGGETIEDRGHFFINGTGILNKWKWPTVPGLSDFKGELLHSAAWNDDYHLKNKRVGVIGAGSSGVQLVAALQGTVKSMKVFIRSPIWVTPAFASQYAGPDGSNFEYTDKQMAGFEGSPQEYKEYQRKLDRALSELTVAFYTDAPEQATLSKLAEEDMKARLKGNTALAEKLIPTFPFGCRRPTPGNGFLEAFSNSSTEAVISPVEQITSKGIRTADGQESEFDVIVCATGFDVSLKPRFPIIGSGGVDLRDQWETLPEGYMGLAVENMPNYFVFLGPSSPVAHGSLVPIVEKVTHYILKAIHKYSEDISLKSLRPSTNAIKDFNEWREEPLKQMVYTADCASWFKNGKKDGPAFAVHPGSRQHYIDMIAQPRWEDFEYDYQDNRFAYLGNGKTVNETLGIFENGHLDEPERLW